MMNIFNLLIIIFILLFFVSTIAFIIGLINPNLVIISGDRNRSRSTKIYGFFALLFLSITIIINIFLAKSAYYIPPTSLPSDENGTPSDENGTPSDENGAPSDENGAPSDENGAPSPYIDYVALLKKAVQNLRPGQITFYVPQEMRVDETKLVVVRISDDLQRDLKEGLGEKPETSQIKVSPFMKARLEGTNFNIKLLSEEKQVLLERQVAEWRWSVTPLEQDEQKLFLTIYARIKIPNQLEEVVDLITFQRTIKVAVNPESWLKQNWKWIVENWAGITAFCTALFVFIVARWQWIKNLIQNRR